MTKEVEGHAERAHTRWEVETARLVDLDLKADYLNLLPLYVEKHVSVCPGLWFMAKHGSSWGKAGCCGGRDDGMKGGRIDCSLVSHWS